MKKLDTFALSFTTGLFPIFSTGVAKMTNIAPQRNPSPAPAIQKQSITPQSQSRQKPSASNDAPVGAFWSSHHAQNCIDSTQKVTVIPKQVKSKSNVGDVVNAKHDEEVNKLKEELKQANLDRAEIASKYDKLSAVCHSQTQEIEDLKRALAAATTSQQSNIESAMSQVSASPVISQIDPPQRDKIDAGIFELEQAIFGGSCPSPQPWLEFNDDVANSRPASNNYQNPSPSVSNNNNINSWATFPTSASQGSTSNVGPNPPLGWAGF